MSVTTPVRASAASQPSAPRGRPPVVAIATVLLGLALGVLVALDGTPAWQAARVAAMAGLTALVVRGLGRRGGRWLALLCGVVGLVVGLGVGVWHLAHGTVDARALTGLGALAAGVALLGAATWQLLRSARGWRKLLAAPVALVVLVLGVYPLVPAVAATNSPRPQLGASTPADVGLSAVDVTFRTRDGVLLSGWYVPSRNGAAVALLHGASSTRTAVLAQAEALADGGYGVLLYDARGHGRSEGRAMELGWYGDLDVAAAVDLLVARPDVDPDRVGVVGMSMGGEQAIGAAAADTRIRAVVAEGATGRGCDDNGWLPTHVLGQLQRAIDGITCSATRLLTSAQRPTPLREAVRATAPRQVLLVAGGAVLGGAEQDVGRWLQAASPDTVELWVVPQAGHTDGLATAPQEWRARVLGFLDRQLP